MPSELEPGADSSAVDLGEGGDSRPHEQAWWVISVALRRMTKKTAQAAELLGNGRLRIVG